MGVGGWGGGATDLGVVEGIVELPRVGDAHRVVLEAGLLGLDVGHDVVEVPEGILGQLHPRARQHPLGLVHPPVLHDHRGGACKQEANGRQGRRG